MQSSEGRRQARPASVASSSGRPDGLGAAVEAILLFTIAAQRGSLGRSGPPWADVPTAEAANRAGFSPRVAELAPALCRRSGVRTSDPPNIGITPANRERRDVITQEEAGRAFGAFKRSPDAFFPPPHVDEPPPRPPFARGAAVKSGRSGSLSPSTSSLHGTKCAPQLAS